MGGRLMATMATRKPEIRLLSQDASDHLDEAGIKFDTIIALRNDGSADIYVKQDSDDGYFHDVVEENMTNGTLEYYYDKEENWKKSLLKEHMVILLQLQQVKMQF